jgi:2-C-methyl-D-erythritol 4-phosphate cytidylyltransferase
MAFSIIAAGGSGDRMGAGGAKFAEPLLGRAMVSYSLDAFENAPSIESVILVVPAAFVERWSAESLRGSGFSKAAATVAGGETRQQSVWLGLQAIGSPDGIVVVHDAARPMVTPELIESVAAMPEGMDGLITAVPVTDTIKRVEASSVSATVERAGLFSVQTPQGFLLGPLLEAHGEAAGAGFEATDDSALIEWRGGRVGVVNGSRENIKVTYPADLLMAEAVLGGRRR